MSIHIGKLIKSVLKTQGRSVTWFAKMLNCNRCNVYNIFKKENLDTELLKRISIILNHNFFQEFSDEMNLQMYKNS